MNRILLTTAISALATAAAAQDLPQAQDAWFTAGAAAIEARMAVQPNTAKAKNVILFTADGNGVGTNYAIRLFTGQKAGGLGDDYVQPFETFPNVALVKTYSSNGQTPDSAPTAAAMNSGIKTKNGMINIMDSVAVGDCAAGASAGTRTFAEIVNDMGKSVGVISTARITHATPAAVYARTVNRDWEDNSVLPEGCEQQDIAAQLIDQMKAGVIDIALGGGRQHFLPEGTRDVEDKEGKRTDDRNLIEEAQALGAQVVFGQDDFTALSTAANNAPILGLFEASHMKYEADRTGEPSLAEMTEAAIKALQGNENGFYLNVEAGRVDHANHDGNLARTLTDGQAFADAIARAMELTDEADTLIIVTADHEHAITFNGYCGRGSDILGLCMEENEQGVEHTGKPNLAADGKPYTVAGFLNGAGSILVEQPAPAAEMATQESVAAPGTAPDATGTSSAATPADAAVPASDAAGAASAADAAATPAEPAAADTTPAPTADATATPTADAAATPAEPAPVNTTPAPAAGVAAAPAADAAATAAADAPAAAPAADTAAAPAIAAPEVQEATPVYAAPEGRPTVTEEESTDIDYLQQALVPMSSETHSGEDVAVFARGPWAHLFGGVIEQNVIFHVMNKAVTAE